MMSASEARWPVGILLGGAVVVILASLGPQFGFETTTLWFTLVLIGRRLIYAVSPTRISDPTVLLVVGAVISVLVYLVPAVVLFISLRTSTLRRRILAGAGWAVFYAALVLVLFPVRGSL
jgi:hypothetical protein